MTTGIVIDKVYIERVLTALQQQGTRYRLEAMERLCPELTCDQIFLAVDYLTRSGLVCLTLDCNRTYWVQASRPVARECSHIPSADSQVVLGETGIS